ncbi:hypothetical protein L1887_37730 [Cichorium endivia]|nr:hypothetical protein L1887_37730 [Cichorium endivia]
MLNVLCFTLGGGIQIFKFSIGPNAMELGMQKISGITVFNTTENKSYDPLHDIEVPFSVLLPDSLEVTTIKQMPDYHTYACCC